VYIYLYIYIDICIHTYIYIYIAIDIDRVNPPLLFLVRVQHRQLLAKGFIPQSQQ